MRDTFRSVEYVKKWWWSWWFDLQIDEFYFIKTWWSHPLWECTCTIDKEKSLRNTISELAKNEYVKEIIFKTKEHKEKPTELYVRIKFTQPPPDVSTPNHRLRKIPPINEPQNPYITPNPNGEVIKNPGGGNCFYYALFDALAAKGNLVPTDKEKRHVDMKIELLRDPDRVPRPSDTVKRLIQSDDEWATDEVIQYAANKFNLTIFVYEEGSILGWTEIPPLSKTDDVVFIKCTGTRKVSKGESMRQLHSNWTGLHFEAYKDQNVTRR